MLFENDLLMSASAHAALILKLPSEKMAQMSP